MHDGRACLERPLGLAHLRESVLRALIVSSEGSAAMPSASSAEPVALALFATCSAMTCFLRGSWMHQCRRPSPVRVTRKTGRAHS